VIYMKIKMFQTMLAVAVAGGFALQPMNVPAQSSSNPQACGVSDIVKLNQAKVGDATIISYIQNSGNSYNLTADQIISLRQQGISDAVITAMLNQPKPAAVPAAVPTPATPAPQPVAPDNTAVTSTATQPAITYVQAQQPSVTYIQTVPTYYYQPYYPAPAYYGYSGWAFPLSLSFAWGNYGHGGGWHGGGWRH
jgi:hypothetical protein